MAKIFFLAILKATLVLTIVMVVNGEDQSDFISIDCGKSDVSSYTDEKTSIVYSSDEKFIETGVNREIAPAYRVSSQDQQLWNLRFFPEGIRNCYNLNPSLGKGNKYLIRARFLYGNYDGENKIPKFDLHLGVELWKTVSIDGMSSALDLEIIHTLSSDHIYVCLVNTGYGTPFISALEIRHIDIDNDGVYITDTGSLLLHDRYAFSLPTKLFKTRYRDDAYDRLWNPLGWTPFIEGPSTNNESSIRKNEFKLPFSVMNTAHVPNTDSRSLGISWKNFDSLDSYKLYFHFTELEKLQANQSREFNISVNGAFWIAVVPRYLAQYTIYSEKAERFELGKLEIRLNSTEKSTSPPLINGLEVYMVKEFSGRETNQDDVEAISTIKSVYELNKLKWQGDPCAPEDYMWDGLNCSYSTTDNSQRIVSLNLSSSGLKGEITTSIANLTLLQNLDLSNNNLSGIVPEFLAQLLFLGVLNLSGNNFTGPIPDVLLQRKKNGLLLSIDTNNSSSSSNSPCSSKSCGKKKNFVLPLVASLGGLLLVICFTTVIIIWRRKRRHDHKSAISLEGRNLEDESYINKMQQYTYSEIQKVTNNFEKVLGEGGFGKVYYGYLNGIEVAVKMLSSSSMQGHRQFHAELKLLLRVHHKNLTTLVGFCNEGSEVGLIYEYMAMGNLRSQLLGGNSSSDMILSWKQRLQIAIDTAQGLEYLHNGCKPPIVHRDVKSTNILLNEKLRAKLGDFGLSKVFANNYTSTFDVTTPAGISASIVGTPGYLDPEYFISNWLNEKSDVYSFGIVLLEIITAQPVVATTVQQGNHLIKWVNSMIAKGDIKNILDPRLEVDTVDTNIVWKVIEIAMACVAKTSTSRPTMSRVALDLQECLTTNIPRNNNHLETDQDQYSTDLDGIISNDIASEFSPLAR
ncbi:putative leucine-rich repeat receptor-like protein kinase At2g19210 isoform X2 [Humulus lupulus]|uniref:putative leucine-rich repeat receptor-like protein kinase At2g19210 isoform X2 n=1 Tax=Humulus lupulus TaxID=3486 RepID=UPI002B4109A0|nr:putative leucine-rich repeat receptor-like protein kinase At2g19210 isoform X2 [Humulus lupulus]